MIARLPPPRPNSKTGSKVKMKTELALTASQVVQRSGAGSCARQGAPGALIFERFIRRVECRRLSCIKTLVS